MNVVIFISFVKIITKCRQIDVDTRIAIKMLGRIVIKIEFVYQIFFDVDNV